MRRLANLALAVFLLGCGDATGILVEVTSTDLGIPSDVDALRFEAVSVETGRTLDQTFAVATTWPHSLTITPSSELDRQVTITVTGLKDGAFVVRRVVPASFTRGTTNRVQIVLSRACVGVDCPAGVDCIAGMCVDRPPTMDGGVDAGTNDGGPLDGGPPGDGGADAGRDAGPADGGPRDAGRDAGPPDSGPPDAGPVDAGTPILFFSEYVEGSSNNKALEITNVGDAPMALSRCQIERYSNGSTSALAIPLTGTLAVGDVHVICNSSLEGAATLCDETTASVNHNGDDAYALVCDGATVDTFGQIGFDPGSEWTGGGLSTLDYVLRRDCATAMGDADGSDAFDPSVGWSGSAWVDAATSLTGLGNRSECP